MKYRIALALTLLSVSAMSQAASPCQEKEQEITREISYAEKHNNQSRVEGLNKALHEVRTTCSDSKIACGAPAQKLPDRKTRLPNVAKISPKRNKKAMRTK